MRHSPTWPTQRNTGFTLIEMLVTVSVLVILTTLAVPSFNNFVKAQRVKTLSFDLFAAITYARSEALKRNGDVTLSAVNGNWGNGWTIASGATTLRSQSAINTTVAITSPSNNLSLTYGRDGRVTGSANTKLQVAANPTVNSISPRCITIDLSGRPNSTLGNCP